MTDRSIATDATAVDRRETWRGAAALLGVLALVTAAALLLEPARPHWWAAVGVAAGVTGVASLGGWFIASRPARSPGAAVASALGGTALRILLPLAALGWLTTGAPSLAAAGGRIVLIAFYLPLLATTIVLTIMRATRSAENPGAD